MKAENLTSQPMKATYKAGVYGTLGLIAMFLAFFIAWSLACLGGAFLDLVSPFF